MESYDIFLLVILVMAVAFGALKGMAWQIASIAAIFVSYFVALNFHELLAKQIQTDEPWNRYIAMFALYMGTSLCIWIAFAIVRQLIEKVQLKDFDRHAGAVLGAINGSIVCLLITFFAVTLPILSDDHKSAICRSKSGHVIAVAIGKIKMGLPEDVDRVVTPYLDGLKEKLDEHQSQPANSESLVAQESELPPPEVTIPMINGPSSNGVQSASESQQNQLNWTPSFGNEEQASRRNLLDEINQHIQASPPRR